MNNSVQTSQKITAKEMRSKILVIIFLQLYKDIVQWSDMALTCQKSDNFQILFRKRSVFASLGRVGCSGMSERSKCISTYSW